MDKQNHSDTLPSNTEDIEKNIENSDSVGIITTANKFSEISTFDKHEVIYANINRSVVLFNGTTTSKHYALEVSLTLSENSRAKIEIRPRGLNSEPLNLYLKSVPVGGDTIALYKFIPITLMPSASVTFKIENIGSNSIGADNAEMIVKIKEVQKQKYCKKCREVFGVPDKYIRAFIILSILAILLMLLFEYLTQKK